ncbi:alanine racemase [Tessaracoccus massiliensis]|uniref:alanine racemase n=1 Tax=Tessaracoccus massiliensis TaxID=1522311 RepID=UPI000B29CF19|nr:alanine racemase [Tessaracoccus massiliensis]
MLDLDAVDANLADLRRRAAGTPLRVASKSLRVCRLLEHALTADGYRGTLAFTLPEALWLAAHGLRDLVVAYPTAARAALARLAADDEARAAITLMVDSIEHLDLIDAAAPGHPEIRVALELDAAYAPVRGVRFGALRSPIRTAAALSALARAVVDRDGFRLVGLMAYEGQIAGVADVGRSAYRQAVRQMKARSARELAVRRAAAVAAVREVADLEFVNGGGTGSLETTCAEDAVTEAAVGSGIVGPGLFDGYRIFRPRAALHFGLDVVRRPAPAVATLLGGGWIASGPPGRDRLPLIAWPAGLKYAPDEAAGEVQTPVLGPAAAKLAVGDTVWLRHAKAGELAERVASYAVVRRVDGAVKVIDEWPTYRGEGMVTL